MQHGILDWTLEHKMAISAKTGEILTKSIIWLLGLY